MRLARCAPGSTVQRPPAFAAPTAEPDNDAIGMTFTQTSSSPVPGTDGILHAGITCCSCSTMGHCASACPSSSMTTGGLQLPQIGGTSEFTFAQSRLVGIPRTWVLLDSQSTASIFNNPGLLRDVRRSATTLAAHTNGGTQVSHLVGDLPNFGVVWFNPQSLANILSLAAMRRV